MLHSCGYYLYRPVYLMFILPYIVQSVSVYAYVRPPYMFQLSGAPLLQTTKLCRIFTNHLPQQLQ